MSKYEINYLVLQSKTSELEKIREEAKNIIRKRGGEITDEKVYLKRKLAYEISHEGYGFFTVLRFELEDSQMIEKIKKDFNLNNDISRYIIVRSEMLPPLNQAPAEEEEKVETQQVAHQTIKQEEVNEIIRKTNQDEIEHAAQTESTKDQVESEEGPAKPEEKQHQDLPEKTKEEKKDDDKTSLDDLDKKLDEILNI